VAGAPVIWNVPSRFPSSSVTDTVTFRFIATAFETARDIICWTSLTVSSCDGVTSTDKNNVNKAGKNVCGFTNTVLLMTQRISTNLGRESRLSCFEH
jgi:hypothetical protein